MKNLLPVLDNLLSDKSRKPTKEESKQNRRYHRDWYSYVGKIAKVNPENLLGLSQQEIVAKYLHTLPEEFRDLAHLYSYLNIEVLAKDGILVDPLYPNRSRWSYKWSRTVYYFDNKTNFLCVIRKIIKKKKVGTRRERLKKFYEEKKAKNKRQRKVIQHKKELYSELLYSLEDKRKEKEQKINLQKIISHGFDPVTSFRHDRQ